MSDEDKILAEADRIFKGVDTDIGYEELLTLLCKFGVTANSFKMFMMSQTTFSEEWINEASMSLFNRFFGV